MASTDAETSPGGSNGISLGAAAKATDFIAKMKAGVRKSHLRRAAQIPMTAAHLSEPPVQKSHLEITSLAVLGEGTSGKAFLVQNEVDARKYCVKCVPVAEGDVDQRTAVQNEARIHSAMRHEAIVRYSYSWMDRSGAGLRFCMLMELCECDLWSCLEAGCPTPVERSSWSLQLAGALRHIHSHHVVHRDLNPWNIFVTGTREVRVGDFGLSARCPGDGRHLSGWTTEGAVPLDSSAVGSLYSAPELGGDAYGQTADVFSLGMVLFVIWGIGTAAPTADGLIEHVEALHESAALPEGFERTCPIARLVLAMVAADASKRPSADEVLRTVHRLLPVVDE